VRRGEERRGEERRRGKERRAHPFVVGLLFRRLFHQWGEELGELLSIDNSAGTR